MLRDASAEQLLFLDPTLRVASMAALACDIRSLMGFSQLIYPGPDAGHALVLSVAGPQVDTKVKVLSCQHIASIRVVGSEICRVGAWRLCMYMGAPCVYPREAHRFSAGEACSLAVVSLPCIMFLGDMHGKERRLRPPLQH